MNYKEIDAIELVNDYEAWLDINNPTGTIERSGDNARLASELLSFLNEKQS